ncbi:hypothetical protein ONZ45_g13018 [Pleurotus djamor]|nr:hypothetical protein ONZ45_g13018 [Pleurotus djamor]
MIALLALVVSVFVPLLAYADSHGHTLHMHHRKDIAHRVAGDLQLHKRFSGARFTWYDVGLGSCGWFNKESDFIVALNAAQYGSGYPGPFCGKTITITCNGKSAVAKIADECPGCPVNGLDFSKGLFEYFADLGAGVLYGEWFFSDGSSKPPPKPEPTSEPKPTTKTSHTLKHTASTIVPWNMTTTHKKPQSTSSLTTTKLLPSLLAITTTNSSSSTMFSTSTTSSSRTSASLSTNSPTPTTYPGLPLPSPIVPNSPQNIRQMKRIVLGLGGLVVAAARSND